MDYRTLQWQRRNHPAWRLLAADSAPFVAAFLYQTFIEPNVRTLGEEELASRLQDFLFYLREHLKEDQFSKPAKQYLDDWCSSERSWLRRYYPPNSDEPHYDITPATEKALDWLIALGQRQFVGTESRLLTIFSLLRDLVEGTGTDPAIRVAELEKRRAAIDAEIQEVQQGRMALLDPTMVKDRFVQMANMARALLSDFRSVEQNFRDLDRAVRERIATWDGSKGALLEQIFGERDVIADSDEGRSFRAFWDFLMSPSRQTELSNLLESVFRLEPVAELSPDRRLLRVHYDWMEAGEVAQRTVARLSEQLRRYLNDQMWLENRRITKLIRDVEQHAIALRDQAPGGTFIELDGAAPQVALSMERPLFSPPSTQGLVESAVDEGDQDTPADLLFEQVYVDKFRLLASIRRALQTREQVSLPELLEESPIEHGLAEVVAYLSIAAESSTSVIDDRHQQSISWQDAEGTGKRATVPLVIFNRSHQPAEVVSLGN